MGVAVFTIGTSTDRINLLNPDGLHIRGWNPAEGPVEEAWSNSPLADYGQPVQYRDMEVEEGMSLLARGIDQDDCIRKVRALRIMFRKARDYWTGNAQTSIVYVEAKASCETNTRYAWVYSGRVETDDDPFAQPFISLGYAAFSERAMAFTRGPWLETRPGTGTAIEISATDSYDGRTLGRAATTAEEVYVGNKQNMANITDVWYWDNAAFGWNLVNLMDTALPYAFMHAPLTTGDFVLFGCDSTLANSGPFNSLVFDIGTAMNPGGGVTLEWRYSIGGGIMPPGWTALTVHDNTNAAGAMTGDPFDTTGVHSVHWVQPDPWIPQDVQIGAWPALGVTAFWVCVYVVAGDAGSTAPTQQNRDIYTITWPCIDVDDGQIPGDMGALIRQQLGLESAANGINVPFTGVIAATRSLARGTGFTPYINFSDEQNAAGITMTAAGVGGFATATTTHTGRALLVPLAPALPPAPGWAAACNIALSAINITWAYGGKFHLFVRGTQILGVPGDILFRFYITEAGVNSYYTKTGEFTFCSATPFYDLIDLGQITLQPDTLEHALGLGTAVTMQLQVYGNNVATCEFYDLILMPCDEYIFQASGETGITPTYLYELDVDSITYPKWNIRATARSRVLGTPFAAGKVLSSDSAQLRENTTQRIWYLFYAGDGPYSARPEIVARPTVTRAARYLSMRGDA